VLALAANGIEALRAINEDEPDVAFLDIRMPGLTGIELARRVDTRTHVVFVTAFDQYAVEAFDREVVDYLLKPVTDERLAKCVERLKRKLAAAERPPGLDEVLAKLARATPLQPRASFAGCARSRRSREPDRRRRRALLPGVGQVHVRGHSRGRVAHPPAAVRAGPQLDAEVFWQIHRGTIVNMNEVSSTRRDMGGRVFVTLREGKTELAVSRAYAHRFKQM
jgi:DNA-binding LytR/AlgR family response regulator